MSSSSSYIKPPLSYAEQLTLLKERGLKVDDNDKALHLLRHIGYYRLSGYWYPLYRYPKDEHIFKENATFDKAFKNYCFDRLLRQLVLSEIEKIEIAVRSQMVNVLSHAYGAKWYADISRFKNINDNHTKSLNKLFADYEQSKEEFVLAFKRKYTDQYPPCWIIMEVASFGRISSLFKNLKGGKSKRRIAYHFGLKDSTLESWLHCLVYLRNICAHHCRFWNRQFGVRPRIPHSPSKQWLIYNSDGIANNRTYFVLSMILYLLQTVNPKSTLVKKFNSLLYKYPNMVVNAMGFPESWKDEPLWNGPSLR